MKLAIMQPYFFPYIGYFQLIDSVDTFLIYDDVNYIKNGWVNRNRILGKSTGNVPVYFGVPLVKASPFKKIYEIDVNQDISIRKKLLKTTYSCYHKSPQFDEVYTIVEEALLNDISSISEIDYITLISICNYLNIDTHIINTSVGVGSNDLSGKDRVIDICKKLECTIYNNAPGGTSL